MQKTRIAIGVATVCLLVTTAFAQSDSSQISGFVKDPSGSIVPNVTVTVTNEATNQERKVQTNESGYYVATNIRPGFYTISAEATGFKKFVKTGNKLDASLPLTVDVTLDVGAVTETVEVVASTATVQSDTATVGRLVERSQIENMMLNGRNPMWLAQLKAGVRSGQSLARFNYDLNNDLQINGGRTQDFAMSFDGAVAIRTRANGTSIGVADVDTVQEIQVLTANYNAEYGRSGSGQVRIVTRSGTRDFHGSLYEYFRNNVLDANSWERNRSTNPSQNEKPPARKFNQFGYIVDGPVYIPGVWNTDRNKLFFLWSQEWVRFREEATETSTVPTALMREGNFSELLGPNTFFSTPRTINDPDTGQPFPGNVIPAGRLSSNGLALLRAYPLPTPGFIQGTNNFIQTRPQPTNQRKDTIALDFNPVEKHSFRFRHQNYSWKRLDAFRGGLDRAVTDWNRPNKTASVNYVWTVSPTIVNEFLTSASIDRVYIGVQREGGRFERSRYGIDYPYIFPERKEIFDKIPTVALGTPFRELDGGPYPAFSSGPIYVVSNNFTKVFSNHTFKVGALFERSGQNDFDQINVTGVPGGTNNQNGRFSFTDNR
ncbi:MAG TPA: carboxypeptidase-like regulatory domain-containing protein, partial [Bryobacteraceae bacterium]|nr:carboxypeptidase-like regulatory domain-containing protein [Bryobacteraceae bacterium]